MKPRKSPKVFMGCHASVETSDHFESLWLELRVLLGEKLTKGYLMERLIELAYQDQINFGQLSTICRDLKTMKGKYDY